MLKPAEREAQVDTVLIRDYSSAWLSFNESGKVFQSFDGTDINAGGFYLSKEELKGNTLRICGNAFSLWQDGRLIMGNFNGCSYISIENISFQEKDVVFMSFSSIAMGQISVELISFQSSTQRVYPLNINSSINREGWILFLIAFMTLASLLKRTSPDIYQDLFRFRSLSFNQKFEGAPPPLVIYPLYTLY